jgi:hypothetical protein
MTRFTVPGYDGTQFELTKPNIGEMAYAERQLKTSFHQWTYMEGVTVAYWMSMRRHQLAAGTPTTTWDQMLELEFDSIDEIPDPVSAPPAEAAVPDPTDAGTPTGRSGSSRPRKPRASTQRSTAT